MNYSLSPYGQLTLIPMQGMKALAAGLKERIERKGMSERRMTPVDVKDDYVFGHHVNGEPYLELDKKHIGGHDCVVLASGPGNEAMLFRLLLMLRYLAARRARRITVVFGYFPLSRSDKDDVNKPVLALPPLVVDLILTAAMKPDRTSLDRIIAVDMHAPQVVMSGQTGLIVPLTLVSRVLNAALSEAQTAGFKTVLAFPDASAAKRFDGDVEHAEQRWGALPQVVGMKRRKTSERSELRALFGDVEQVKDATVLTLDDEIATGGTNIDSARELKERYGAARVWALVTHGVLCGPAVERFIAPDCPVERIFCTDTIPMDSRSGTVMPSVAPIMDSGRLTIVPWTDDLAKVIFYHHWDVSIRERR